MATKTKTTKPRTDAAKADRLGAILATVAQYDAEIRELKGYFASKGKGVFPGDRWTISVGERTQSTMDVRRLRIEAHSINLLNPKTGAAGKQVPTDYFNRESVSHPVTYKANPDPGIVPMV